MDKVQFQLESTLPELKDLHEKGLFSRVSLPTDVLQVSEAWWWGLQELT